MIKRFFEWIHKKIALDDKSRLIEIKEHEVYWCSIGENIGDEENGKGTLFRRPVLIVKKFNNNIFWGIPMSTKLKNNPYYIRVLLKDLEQSVMISQLRILDSKRLDQYIGYISQSDMRFIKQRIIKLLQY